MMILPYQTTLISWQPLPEQVDLGGLGYGYRMRAFDPMRAIRLQRSMNRTENSSRVRNVDAGHFFDPYSLEMAFRSDTHSDVAIEDADADSIEEEDHALRK